MWTCLLCAQWWWRRIVGSHSVCGAHSSRRVSLFRARDARESKATSRDALRPFPPEEELSCTLHAPAAPPRVFRESRALALATHLKFLVGGATPQLITAVMAEKPATARTGIPFPKNPVLGDTSPKPPLEGWTRPPSATCALQMSSSWRSFTVGIRGQHRQ